MTVRAALVGYGLAGRAFHAPVIAAADGVRLHRVVSSRPEAVRHDLPEIDVVPALDDVLADADVDLVVIATPNDTHFELAERALRAGKHTVVDKPMVTRAREAERLAGIAEEHGRVLSVYQNRRWDDDFLTLRSLLDDGRLGRVVEYESRFDRFRPAIKTGWREEPVEGAGLLWDIGPHLIDQALVLFGLPDTVQADLQAQRDGARVDDWFHLVLARGPLRILLHAGTLVADPGPRLGVHGTRASFRTRGLDPQEGRLRSRAPATSPKRVGTLTDGETGATEEVPLVPGRYTEFYERLARAIADGAENPVPPEEAAAVIRVLEAAIRSSEEGRRVRL